MSDQISCLICDNKKNLRPVNEIVDKGGMACTYLDALFRCFNIQFLDSYGKDVNRICGRCVAKLRYCCAFRKDVEAAHRRQYQIIDTVGKPIVLKNENAEGNSEECVFGNFHKEEDEEFSLFGIRNLKKFSFENAYNKQADDQNSSYDIENEKIIPSHNEFREETKLNSQYDYYDHLDNIDDCNIEDSPYHSDWSVNSYEINQATGCIIDINQPRKRIKSYRIDQSLCEVCGKMFANNRNLLCHVKVHLGVGLHCSDCSKIYYNKRDLTYHIKTRHLGMKTKKCGVCGLRFYNLSGKRKHLLEVHEKKTLRCLYCVKTFRTRPEAKKHIRDEHMDISKYNCVECDLVFLGNPEMRDHMLVHTGTRDHHCQLCSKSFVRLSNLKQHMKSHNKGERKKNDYLNTDANVWANHNFT